VGVKDTVSTCVGEEKRKVGRKKGVAAVQIV
jgi:hypothetical protein